MSERPVVIVTGGSAGIGAAICRQMIDAGYEAISVARRKPDWSHAALHAVEVDLTDAKATAQVASDLARRFPIAAVVHNAGVIRPSLLPEVSQDDLSELAQLHLGAAILLVQAALPGMRERRYGRIVLISSRAALGLPTRTVYSATKAGMIGMARTWALELAASGITVNVVAPGPILTDNFWGVIPKGSEQQERMARNVPVGRLGSREDVAHAISFFLDERSDFVTGQVLYVCGGTSLVGLGP
jgi:NAD(P)-dependent dehydrogenase (short-subunit alcohol dehydrogenase family)